MRSKIERLESDILFWQRKFEREGSYYAARRLKVLKWKLKEAKVSVN